MPKPMLQNKHENNGLGEFRLIEKELKARLRQQAAVARMGQMALTSTSLLSLMDEIVAYTAQTLDVDLCKILELMPDGQELRLLAGVGWKEGIVRVGKVSAGLESQAGYTLQEEEPVIVTDLRTETRFSGPPLLHDHGVISGISVVIPGARQPYGVLGVHTREIRVFTQDDANFLQSVANLLASSIFRFNSEDAVRSSRDQLSIILQGVSDGVTVQDKSGQLVYVNSTAARLMGYPSEQALISAPIKEIMARYELFDEEGRPFPFDQLPGRKALIGKGPCSATVRFRYIETGEERWSSIRANPVFNKAGEVELAVNIFQDITEYKRTEKSRLLLAEAGSLLASSLDVSEIVKNISQLAITHLSDWCVVYLKDGSSTPRTASVAHIDPEKIRLVSKYQEEYPPDWDAPYGVAAVTRNGEPEFYPEISEELLQKRFHDPKQLEMVKKLGFRSGMTLPFIARGRVIGSVILVWAESRHVYSQNDIILAEELARLSALAIDNANLYKEAQELNSSLEFRVTKRTSQLQTTISMLKNEIGDRKRAEEALRESEKMLESLFESAPDAIILVNGEGAIIRINQQTEALFGHSRTALVGKAIEELLPKRFKHRHNAHRQSYLAQMIRRPMGAGLELYGLHRDGSEFPIDIMLSPVETSDGPLVICAIRDISERKQMETELSEVQRRLLESIEAERLHIAQELHDGPIQDLYGVNFYLNSLVSLVDAEEMDSLRETNELIKQIITNLRSLCSEMRPPSLAPFGLEKAIRGHLEKVGETTPGLTLNLDLKPDEQLLPERTRLALFRIYQHAISNVLRHAQASHLDVILDYDDNELQLEISDDGSGFELPSRWVQFARNGHLGLVGTVERAEAIGARLKIDTAPGKGTKIQITLPLKPENANQYGRPWFARLSE